MMGKGYASVLKGKLDAVNLGRLEALRNEALRTFVADAVALCEPDSVLVCDDSEEMVNLTRRRAGETGEETPLAISGHTVHFDGILDQGRDREVTRYLVPEGESFPKALGQVEREAGLAEIREIGRASCRERVYVTV